MSTVCMVYINLYFSVLITIFLFRFSRSLINEIIEDYVCYYVVLLSTSSTSISIYPLQSLSWYVQLRPEELGEIDFLKKDATVTVKGPVEETPGKVIFLI